MQPAKGCESAGMQQRVCMQPRVGLDLRDGELQVVAECLRLCARRGGSRGVAAVVGRRNKGQLQEERVM